MRRMRSLITVGLLLVIAGVCRAERLSVVVGEFDGNGVSAQTAQVVSDHFRLRLISSRRFIVPERERMEQMLAEQEIGVRLGECFSQECAIELGRLMQANKMVVGTVSMLNATYSVNIRLLDLATGTAEFSADQKCHSVDDLYTATETLVNQLVAFNPLSGSVTAVHENNVIISIGEQDGATPGLLFRVTRSVERVPGYPEETEMARGRIVAVQPEWSRLEISGATGSAAVRQGDAVREVFTDELHRSAEREEDAQVTVYSDPAGATVSIDGYMQGTTGEDGLMTTVSPGTHTIAVAGPNGDTNEQTVTLAAGEHLAHHVMLERTRPSSIVVHTTPVGARVTIDERFRGITREGGLKTVLEPGRHTIRISKIGSRSETRTVILGDGETEICRFTLEAVEQSAVSSPSSDVSTNDSEPSRNAVYLLLGYHVQTPGSYGFYDDLDIREEMDESSIHSIKFGLGVLANNYMFETGGFWGSGPNISGYEYGREHNPGIWRKGWYFHVGMAPPVGRLVPHVALGYEIDRLTLEVKEDNGDDDSTYDNIGPGLWNNGFYWEVGLRYRWVSFAYRKTFSRDHANMSMLTFGLTISSGI